MNDSLAKNRIMLPHYVFTEGMPFSRRDLITLMIPVILETLLMYLLGMMDTVMVSSAGESAVAAVSMVDSICVLFVNAFFSFSVGGAVICGQYLGAKDQKMAKSASEHLIWLVIFISLIFTMLLLLFKFSVMNFLYGTASSDVLENCYIYYNIVIPSIPFIAIYNAGAAIYRISGDSKTPLQISLITNVINVAGNAYMVYVLKMGVAGVAIPTLFSRFLSCVLIILLLLKKDFKLNILGIFSHKVSMGLFSKICSIAIPNGIENGLFYFGRLMLVSIVSTLTTADIAANAVGNTMGPIHVFIGNGINSVLMTAVSRSVGADDYDQARWYTGYLFRLAWIIQGIFNICLTFAIPIIVKIFHLSEYTAVLATNIQLVHGLSTAFIWPFAFMLNISMRAAGDSQYAMWISSISMWVCRVLGSYILIKIFGIGVIGVWIAWIVDWLFRITFFVPRYLSKKWEGKAVTKKPDSN